MNVFISVTLDVDADESFDVFGMAPSCVVSFCFFELDAPRAPFAAILCSSLLSGWDILLFFGMST